MRPTLLIDEADMLRESKQLRTVLNAGFQPGTPIIRKNASYDVFCSKAFSGITADRPPVTEATLSRCIQIPMRRRGKDEHAERFSRNQALAETAALPGAPSEWRYQARDALENATPMLPDGLSERQADTWLPLLAIADYLGGTWPDDARGWAVELSRAIPQDPDPGVQLLRDVKRILDRYPGTRIPTRKLTQLIDALDYREYNEELSPVKLGKRLSGFGIRPEPSPFRMRGRDSPLERGFIVRRGGNYTSAWQDAFERYEV